MQTPRIKSYCFNRIIIDGHSFSHDVIIYPDRIDGGWWREEGHSVAPSDLREALESHPDVLVIGQGKPGRMEVLDDTRRKVEEAGIELIVQPTSEAVATYNRLSKVRRVVAALHLTC
jgi:hypothetical protein